MPKIRSFSVRYDLKLNTNTGIDCDGLSLETSINLELSQSDAYCVFFPNHKGESYVEVFSAILLNNQAPNLPSNGAPT